MSNHKISRSRLALAIGSALAASAPQAATITVDTLQDPGGAGECSLRSAVQAVYDQTAVYGCSAGDGINDQIVFESGLTGTLALNDGQIHLDASVSIVGPGSENLTIDAQSASRVFVVANGANVGLSGVTLTEGYESYGGALYLIDNGVLSLSDCVVSGNYATGNGGAIEVYNGYLSVDNCEFSGNESVNNGGAIAVTSGTAVITGSEFTQNSSGLGGALMVNNLSSGPQLQPDRGYSETTSLHIYDSVISGNDAVIGGGVGAGYFYGGGGKLQARNPESGILGGPVPGSGQNLTIESSLITGNAAVLGGGIGAYAYSYNPQFGTSGGGYETNRVTVYDSQLTSNTAEDAGGGIGSFGGTLFVYGGQIDGNEGGGIDFVGPAGGLFSPPNPNNGWARGEFGPLSDLTVVFSSVSGNSGGGILAEQGNVEMFASQVDGNAEGFVGGFECGYAAQCLIAYSSITNNDGNIFGGVLADSFITRQTTLGGSPAALIINSSTISGNTGGAVGGVLAFESQIVHSTIAFNAQTGGLRGPQQGFSGAGGLVTDDQSTLSHVIVANNTSVDGSNDVEVDAGAVSMNFSLVGDSTGLSFSGANNLLDVDPLLGPLAANGSVYSLTHALLNGSPAINAGDATIANAPYYDQRGPGFDRIIDGVIDMGAFEAAGVPVEPEVGLSLSQIDFIGTLVGLDESAQLTISSVGSADLELGQLSFGSMRGVIPFGLANDNCSGQTLPPSADCTVDVTFQPPGRGLFDAVLLVPSNAIDSPAEVPVSGAGVAPELAIAPGSINFGNVLVGNSANGSVNLSNVGDAPLELTGTDVAAPFGLVAGAGLCFDGGTTTLAPTESCTLTFSFAPVAIGNAAQTVTVTSDSLGGDSSVALSGAGIDGSGPPPAEPAIPVPIMSRVATFVLAGGLMMLGLFGLRRRLQ